jgi:hypothetical protein
MDEVYDTDISDEDYGFILGPDGELKALFLPDVVPFKAPKTVAKILKVLGIQDISNVDGTEPIH